MEGWVGLVGWPIADTLPTKWVHVSNRSGKVRQPKTDVLTTESRHVLKGLLTGGRLLAFFRYCESRRKVLLDHVHEGYDKEFWEYLEAVWPTDRELLCCALCLFFCAFFVKLCRDTKMLSLLMMMMGLHLFDVATLHDSMWHIWKIFPREQKDGVWGTEVSQWGPAEKPRWRPPTHTLFPPNPSTFGKNDCLDLCIENTIFYMLNQSHSYLLSLRLPPKNTNCTSGPRDSRV